LETVAPESPKERKKTPPELPPRPIFPVPDTAQAEEVPTFLPERRLSTKIAEGLITGVILLMLALLLYIVRSTILSSVISYSQNYNSSFLILPTTRT